MKSSELKLLVVCMVVGFLALVGCGKKADEDKPLSEVKAEAEQMNVEKLRQMALAYEEAILGKRGEVEKLAAELKGIPVAEMLGSEAKEIKAEIENLNKSISALKERFGVYYNKLKEKGGDLSGLKI